MKPRTIATLALAVLASACGTPAKSPKQELSAGDLRKSGTIHFPVTCRPEVKSDFEAAVALLHSFFYEEARKRFLDVADRDPACAMAWWGVAMTWYHPLWAPPTREEMRKGTEAAEKAGNPDAARKHYRHLLKMTRGGEGTREELKTARNFLGRTTK